MAPGELLEVTVDHAPAVENVPRSLETRGHAVLQLQENEDRDWTIIVRKREHE